MDVRGCICEKSTNKETPEKNRIHHKMIPPLLKKQPKLPSSSVILAEFYAARGGRGSSPETPTSSGVVSDWLAWLCRRRR